MTEKFISKRLNSAALLAAFLLAVSQATTVITIPAQAQGLQAMQSQVGAGQAVENFQRLASIQMPAGWVKQQDPTGPGYGALPGYSIKYCSPDDDDTKIGVTSMELPMILDSSSQAFRDCLKQGPRVIYSDANPITEQDEKTIQSLEEVLGNAANNQVSKHSLEAKKGYTIHNYHLQRVEVINVGGQPVLSYVGWYQDRDNRSHGTKSWVISIDATPADKKADVQHIYLEADEDEEFQKALPLFQNSLNTLKWKG
ncbi:MAG: hypothetical protein K2X29_13730 [Candidatus Obscuribacterales bacterium]|nr:hypothetical protein [Candidatus Obscuribacterales bacterium]